GRAPLPDPAGSDANSQGARRLLPRGKRQPRTTRGGRHGPLRLWRSTTHQGRSSGRLPGGSLLAQRDLGPPDRGRAPTRRRAPRTVDRCRPARGAGRGRDIPRPSGPREAMLVSGMFPPVSGPRIFALPPGVDFIAELVAGIEARLEGAPPEAWAEVEIFLNTRRAARALETRLASGPARLLPRIRTVPDLASDPLLVPAGLPPAGDPLRRRLDLARLVRAL